MQNPNVGRVRFNELRLTGIADSINTILNGLGFGGRRNFIDGFNTVPSNANLNSLLDWLVILFPVRQKSSWWQPTLQYDTLVAEVGISRSAYPSGFICGVNIPNGNIITFSADNEIGIFKPTLDTLTAGPVLSSETGQYYGGVLLQDGNVLFIPNTASNVAIYNPTQNTLELGALAPNSWGGTLMADGRVFFCPSAGNGIAIYDPVADSLTVGETVPIEYRGAVLTPSGAIVMIPYDDGEIRIWDKETITVGPTVPSGTYSSGILLPDGNVLLIPSTATSIQIYNPRDNTLTAGPTITGDFRNGFMLPDGRCCLTPYDGEKLGIYDYRDNTFSFGPNLRDLLPSGGYSWGTVGIDGDIHLVPNTAERFIRIPTDAFEDSRVIQHPFWNKI